MTDGPSVQRVRDAFERIAEVDRPEVWITLRSRDDALADAAAVDRQVANGEERPLAGSVLAVKDNIDVHGLPTTAGAPGFAYLPTRTASAVQRLIDAGAVVLGKTNLDQFATGLVGTRSPYGAVRHAADPALISGGSSSGSATAVALDIVDIGIGTDTAGSGRVPAALNGLVGITPTLGLVPNTGLVPASRSYDVITVMAKDLKAAVRAAGTMAGLDDVDPRARVWPSDAPLAAPRRPRVAVGRARDLHALTPQLREVYEAEVVRLNAVADVEEIDVRPLLDVATLLYDGAIVAERYAAVGRRLDAGVDGADPTVAEIVINAASWHAWEMVGHLERVDLSRQDSSRLFRRFDALALPTVPFHPTIASVKSNPVATNRRMGSFTNFVNLLDLAAITVPSDSRADGRYGLSIITPAFHDQVGIDIAARLLDEPAPRLAGEGIDNGTAVAVFGAHLAGQPLNHELESLGARFIRDVRTARRYRLVALPTVPKKPGLIPVSGPGASIAGELWQLSPASLGHLLAELPEPMTLGKVKLIDGSEVVGFGVSPDSAADARDITSFGSWRAYLAADQCIVGRP